MNKNKTIPVVKYKVFEVRSDGLVKIDRNNFITNPSFLGEVYNTMELAAKAVHDENGQYNEYVILPIASYDWE